MCKLHVRGKNARSVLRRAGVGCFGNFELLRFTGPKKQSGVLGARNFSIGGMPRRRKIVRSEALSLSALPTYSRPGV